MTFSIPDDRIYSQSHEWALVDSNIALVGITDFAQDELGDIVFLELPTAGDILIKEQIFGLVESIKAVSDLYAPLSGTVLEINSTLETEPEQVNDDPYNTGWLLKIELKDPSEIDTLLTAEEYGSQTN
ncbi:glycine cleavage system protein GcvH [Candidatus Hikarchaeum yamanae]|uniref:glycine cleavage system protein GcvH n=1 Tax=Candidatus Hikarchaeum yamanae TaxID=2675326 RepID=UPI0039EAD76F|tara:strand:- start:59668 stop:60051 length:384 start_codon:yes stop_codon:yes gene_type:complete